MARSRFFYNDELFFRTYCDFNPEYFNYSTKKSITIEQVDNQLYANIVFLESQEGQAKRYDASTQMLTLKEVMNEYTEDFHPVVWKERLGLENKFRLTLP